MCAGGLGVDRTAVMVGVVVPPLLVADHLQGLTQVHQDVWELGQADHPAMLRGGHQNIMAHFVP